MADYAARAADLAALAREDGDCIDRERALTPRLVDALRQHGFFRLLVPRELGGAQLPLPDYVPLIETLATGDASTAWCVNQSAVYATMATRASAATALEIWGDPNTSVSNGPPVPAQVDAVEGGYRLSGQWHFSSGCRHANWVAAATTIDGRLQVAMLPIGDVQLVDNWQVAGLRGTGSFSFVAANCFVPRERVFRLYAAMPDGEPLYRVPINLDFAAGFAATALGNARGALDTAFAVLGDKRAVFESEPTRSRTSVQLDIARAEALWRGAHVYLHDAVATLWRNAERVGGPDLETRLGLRLAATHVIHASAEAVQIVYTHCGTTGMFVSHALQRRFQDAHVITQQVQGRLVHYETVGQHLLGMEAKAGFW